jgi:signal peptidase I
MFYLKKQPFIILQGNMLVTNLRKQKKNGGVVEFLKTILYALILAGIIRTLLFQPFWIPSGSMKPTLLVGDFIFVNKFAYGYSRYSCPFAICPIRNRLFERSPKRGDVVVFRHPENGKDFVKRLVGLPGDVVRLKEGKLFINESEVDSTKVEDFIEIKSSQGPLGSIPRCKNAPVALGGYCSKDHFIEQLTQGFSHSVLDIGSYFGDNTPGFEVPTGHYFFLGDNRDNSLDSRFGITSGGVGYVPANYLIGRVDRIIFSSAGSSMLYFWTWRANRFFKAVN